MRVTNGGVDFKTAVSLPYTVRRRLIAIGQWTQADYEGKKSIYEDLLLNGQLDDEAVDRLYAMVQASAPRKK